MPTPLKEKEQVKPDISGSSVLSSVHQFFRDKEACSPETSTSILHFMKVSICTALVYVDVPEVPEDKCCFDRN